jgi:hypothetical protein
MRAAVLLVAAAVLLAGCGGGGKEAVPAPPAVDRAVRAMFADYTRAMRDGDYARACRHLAPETVAGLRDDARRLSAAPPRTCAGMLAMVTRSGTADQRRQLAQVTRTARIDGVYTAEREDAAIIAWAATVDGERLPIQQPARRVGGRWRLVGASK